MRKSILRFGALALMSMMSIGAFAENTEGEVFTGSDGNKYQITTRDTSKEDGTTGEVMLVQWIAGKPTVFGSSPVGDSYDYEFICTAIAGKGDCTVSGYGNGAFYNTNPGTVTIKSSVTWIGKEAFKLTGDVTIDLDAKNFTQLGKYAFTPADGKKVTLTLPDDAGTPVLKLNPSVTCNNNSEGAFSGVTFPAGTRAELGITSAVTTKLFAGSENLTYVLFEGTNHLTEVGSEAFKSCNDIRWFGYYDNVNNAHFIPSTLRTVSSSAFEGAFAGSPEFKFSAAAKENNKAIYEVGASAFKGCAWLNNEYFCNLFPAELGPASGGGDYVKVSADLIFGDESFAGTSTTPNGLSDHYDFTNVTKTEFINAFKYNPYITNAYLNGDAVETIGKEAFQGCTRLKSVTGLNKVTEIKQDAFLNCTSLSTCDLTKATGLTTIGNQAFKNTDQYVDVWIPNSVTFIGEDAFTRENENSAAERIISILSKESTEANATSKVIESYKHCTTTAYGVKYYHATQPITNYTNTKLVVPMGLMKAYATPVFPYSGHPYSCSTSPEGYDWTPAAETHKLYTYNTNANKEGDKIYVGKYEYTVTADWSNQYTADCSEYPLVKLTNINNVALPTNSNNWTSYTETLYDVNVNSDKTKDFTFQLPQTVCAVNEWDKDAAVVTKKGPENTHDGFLDLHFNNNNSEGVNFVFYWVEATEKMSDIGTNHTLFPNAIENHVTKAEVQANSIDLTSVFKGCTNLAQFDFKGYPTLVNANNNTTPMNAVTGWYGAIGAPTEAALGNDAFSGCTSLTSFNGVDNTFIYTDARVGSSAFLNCPLPSVTIPENVKYIAPSAYNGTKITEVVLPSNLLEIYDYAFANTKLTSVSLPGSVVKICGFAFDGKLLNPDPENTDPETGLRKDGVIDGVADIYAYWEDPTLVDINTNAFGDYVPVLLGDETKYIVRRLYIPDGTTAKYAATAPFNDNQKFAFAEGIIAKTTANPTGRVDIVILPKTGERILNIEDKGDITDFKISKDAVGVKVNYKRKFAVANIFNPLFVPFSVKGIGDNYAIYKVFDTKVIDNGDGTESTSIEYVKLGAEEYTKPNVPYVILPEEEEITLTAHLFEGKTYFATPDATDLEATPRVTCSNAKTNFSIYGTYNAKAGDDTFYVLTSGNRFAKLTTASGQSVKALRFYMTSSNKTPGTEYFYIKGLDIEEATAIENVKAGSLNAPMFDLMGRQITTPAKGQVYIQNGVKKLAK